MVVSWEAFDLDNVVKAPSLLIDLGRRMDWDLKLAARAVLIAHSFSHSFILIHKLAD